MQDDQETPPENANDWSSEQWIDWLKATDRAEAPSTEVHFHRVTRSTGGQLLGNAMIGLARALYGPPPEKPAIVVESGEPDSDQPLDLHLDPDNPERSFAVLRRDPDPSASAVAPSDSCEVEASRTGRSASTE